MTDKVLSIGMVVVVNSVVEGDALGMVYESRIRERERSYGLFDGMLQREDNHVSMVGFPIHLRDSFPDNGRRERNCWLLTAPVGDSVVILG